MTARPTEDLIRSLAQGLRPVRRLRPPALRATLWLAAAGGFVLAVALYHGLRPDLARHLSAPHALLQLVTTVATALTAALAAFHLALPDRDGRWALLPLVPAGLWLASAGYGCLIDYLALGPGALRLGVSVSCFRFIVVTSLPLVVTLLVMLRHAADVRPTAVAASGALAAAALASAGLTLFHRLDSSLMIMIWHGLPVALVAGASALAGRRAMAALERRASPA